VPTGFSARTNYKISFRVAIVTIDPQKATNIIVVGLFTQIYYKDFSLFSADGKQLSTVPLDPGQIYLSFRYGTTSAVFFKINEQPEEKLPLPGLPWSGLVHFGTVDFTNTNVEEDSSHNVVYCSYMSIF